MTTNMLLDELWAITKREMSPSMSTRERNQHRFEWAIACARWGGEWMPMHRYISATGTKSQEWYWPKWYTVNQQNYGCLRTEVIPLFEDCTATNTYPSSFDVPRWYNKNVYSLRDQPLSTNEFIAWINTLPHVQQQRIALKEMQLFETLGPGDRWLQQHLPESSGFLSSKGWVPHCKEWIINDNHQWNNLLNHQERLDYICKLPTREYERLFSSVTKADPLLSFTQPRAAVEDIQQYVNTISLKEYDIPDYWPMANLYSEQERHAIMLPWLEKTSLADMKLQSHEILEWIENEPWVHSLVKNKLSHAGSYEHNDALFWEATFNVQSIYHVEPRTYMGPHGWKMGGLLATNRARYLEQNSKSVAWIKPKDPPRIPDVSTMLRYAVGYHADTNEYRTVLDLNSAYQDMYREWTGFDTQSLLECLQDIIQHEENDTTLQQKGIEFLPKKSQVLQWLWNIQQMLPNSERSSYIQLAALMDIEFVVTDEQLDLEKSSIHSKHYIEQTVAFLQSFVHQEKHSIDFLEVSP